MNLLWIVLCVAVQEPAEVRSVTISKSERSTYLPVLEKYRQAEATLAGDPLECANRCTELIEDKALKDAYRESRVRLQNTDGSYGEWTLFVPFQLRGRAWMARARALAERDPQGAAELARKAVLDFEESLRRGLKSGGGHLEQAQKLARMTDPRAVEAIRKIRNLVENNAEPEALLRLCDDAAAILKGTLHENEWRVTRDKAAESRLNAFRARWTEHAAAGRFVTALEVVKTQGAFLSEKDRRDAAAEIETRCRRHVDAAVDRFQANLRDTLLPGQAWTALAGLAPAEFERRFSLPEAGELTASAPALEWGRRCRDRLVQIRQVPDPQAAPLANFLKVLAETGQMAVDAAGSTVLATSPQEDRAVAALETLALDLARARMEKVVKGAADVPPEQLRARRAEAQAIAGAVQAFASRLEKELKERAGLDAALRRLRSGVQQIEALPSGFPIDPARIDEIGKALFDPDDPAGPWGETPLLALEGFEKDLRQLDQKEGARLTKESRRKLETYRLIAIAWRLLLLGQPVEKIAQEEEVRDLGRRLNAGGGPIEDVMKRCSPKIQAVARRVRP